MEKKIKITVIMPVHNGEACIGEAIESILSQTFTDFELIVIDGGSTDETRSIVRSFKEKDERVVLMRPRRDFHATMNAAMRCARGKHMVLMNSDDEMITSCLEIHYDYLEAHPARGRKAEHLPVVLLRSRTGARPSAKPKEQEEPTTVPTVAPAVQGEASCLTVIIPFLNEREEVEKTIISIRDTAAGNPKIILINDCSNDGFNYEAVAGKYGCRYISHNERRGVAASRDEGVSLCETPYFILLDAHMEFYENGWDVRLENFLKSNPRTLFCLQTRILWETRENVNTAAPAVFGAVLVKDEQAILKCTWNYTDPAPDSNTAEIECPLGGAYACAREYWQHLGGLRGLVYYGMDEEMTALKIRRDGGRCVLIKDMVAGHVYRSKFPYIVETEYITNNQLLIANTLLDGDERLIALDRLRKKYNP